MMSLPVEIYTHLVDFLCKGKTLEEIMAFKATPSVNKRVKELILKKKKGTISPEETSEFQYYMTLDNVVSIAKARAHQKLAQ